MIPRGGRGGCWGEAGAVRGLPYKKDRVARRTFKSLNELLVPLRMFNLKRSAAGAFAVPFKVLSRKNTVWQEIMCCFSILRVVFC